MTKASIPIDDATRQATAAESRHLAMLSAIPDMVFRLTTDGTYIDMHVPDDLASLVAPGVQVGANLHEVMPSDLADEAVRVFRQVADTGVSQTIEYALEVPSGKSYFESRIVRGGPDEVVTLVRDTSRWVWSERERAHAEALLRESEARYRELIDALPDGVYRSSPDGRLLDVNPAFVRMLGYDTKEEVLALDLPADVYFPGEREEIIGDISTDSHVIVFRVRRKDGSVIWVEDHGNFVRDEAGDVILHEGIARNITDRVDAERALAESERRFRELFDQSAQLAGLIATDGTLLAANAAARRYLAKGQSAGIGRPFWDTPWWSHSTELQEQVKEWIARAVMGESSRFEALHPDERGELRRVSGTVAPLRDPNGRVEYVVISGFDVTESWRLRREILEIAEQERARIGRELHDGLGQQLTGLGLMARALEQRLDSREAEEAKDVRQFREIIHQALNYTRHLSRDLLPIPLEKGGLSEALEDLALNTTELFRLPVRANVECTAHIDDSDAAMHLYQIARESVTNAARHANAQYISIDLNVTPEATILSVLDNGVGMPLDGELNEGIGVPTMRYRARQLGAAFEMKPSASGGTLVECILPVGRPQ